VPASSFVAVVVNASTWELSFDAVVANTVNGTIIANNIAKSKATNRLNDFFIFVYLSFLS
jgi:hypothetical protein